GRADGAVFSGPAGRGAWENGTGCRRARSADRGAGCGRQNWGAALGGGSLSAERRADAPTVQSPKSKVQSREKSGVRSPKSGVRSGRMFFEGYRDCATARGEVVGVTGSDELEPAVAAAGQERRSPPDAGRDLRLVHRRV